VDRLIQHPPRNFDAEAKQALFQALQIQYPIPEMAIPIEIVSALALLDLLNEDNPLIAALHSLGSVSPADEDECKKCLDSIGPLPNEEQVASALLYCAISQTPSFSPIVLVQTIRAQVSRDFNWVLVLAQFDLPYVRVTNEQFLCLYQALRPLAVDREIDIQRLWGGSWINRETQLSFLCAFVSLSPDQLDATSIPGLETSFHVADFAGSEPEIQELAAEVAKSTLTSLAAVSAVCHVALENNEKSDTPAAKRLFQIGIVPELHTFMVSVFGVPRPWSDLAADTINSLFEQFVLKKSRHYNFVLANLWHRDKQWVASRLVEIHAKEPMALEIIYSQVLKHQWLDELAVIPSGFALDLVAYAHSKGDLNIEQWGQVIPKGEELAESLLTFLGIKASHELGYQRDGEPMRSVMLPIKTIASLLEILDSMLPKDPSPQLIHVQRNCITAYPRLINYGGDYDDIIDANGAVSNALPKEANNTMEEHYKRMYSEELAVRDVVDALDRYKHSRDPSDQDVFACMIHGLFDEFSLYNTYPLEALATTAVLFGGIIHSKLISELPLEIGLQMILEAVRDYSPADTMYKFGLQALLQLFSRLEEWPGYCRHLLKIPGLRGTEVWRKAEDVTLNHEAHNGMNGGAITNGNIDEMVAVEPTIPQFASLNVEAAPLGIFEPPDDAAQETVLFVLNNVTGENLDVKFSQLAGVMEDRHFQWFAQLIVEERAKMQPNYHQLYLDLLKLFGNRNLWAEILRETYVSVIRMLNSDTTMQSAAERTYLKNLGGWLGYLTLARDKPIKHKNIAFKQLLLEAYDTQRLIIVIPFVCKVLVQGRLSTVFKPPNPWLMDILHLLMELYKDGDLKLNLKFEIEVLCKDLKLDHKAIEPSKEIMSRIPPIEEATEPMVPEIMDRFDDLSLNGLGGGVGSGRFSPQEITSSIPDLGPLLHYPPTNDLVNQARLQEIVRTAITRAVHEIISPVVERSVTIAAISTAQMIHKDFAIEPDEHRVRSAAINMVKKTAGSLALVTSKEPLRASMTNYIRTLAMDSLPQGLPEGTIIMCVNSNLDLACSQVEKKAEERAVPEIEDMIEPELELRRHHQATRPGSAYQDPGLSRWALTIPPPYKLQPNMEGLNSSQLAIYEEFARQPRVPSLAGTTHVGTSSDATRSIANDILQDQYPAVSAIPTPAEAPSMPIQQSVYSQPTSNVANGMPRSAAIDPRSAMGHIQGILHQLEQAAADAPEQHYKDLPRQHELLNLLDGLYNIIIRYSQSSETYDLIIMESICAVLFGGNASALLIESLVHVLENTIRIGGRCTSRIAFLVTNKPPESWLSVPLVIALINAEIVDWQCVDKATSKNISDRRDGTLEFLSSLVDSVLINDHPIALYTDLVRSLELAWQWIDEEPSMEAGVELKEKLINSGLPQPPNSRDDRLALRRDQMEYVFDEWVHLCSNPNAGDRAATNFISQMYNKQIINDKEDLCMFIRLAIDLSVYRFETSSVNSEAYMSVDSLAKLVAMLVMRSEREGEVKHDKAAFLKLALSVMVLVLNYHHVTLGERFNQRVFARLFSTLLAEFETVKSELETTELKGILLAFADSFLNLRPSYFPGFVFGFISLISHRAFLPNLMELPGQVGWRSFSNLLGCLMAFVSDLLKPETHSPLSKILNDATTKLFLVIQHDFPDFLAAYHSQIVSEIPSHCTFLMNLVLTAEGHGKPKAADPMQGGLKTDRADEIRESPETNTDVEEPLRQSGLFEVLDQALQSGSIENAIAVIAHEIQKKKALGTGFGFAPINVDVKLINSIVVYVGTHAAAKASQNGTPIFVENDSSARFLSMIVHELRPEARYYMLSAIVNQLRFPNNETHYFCQALLSIWGSDRHVDSEESDIREQITRVLLERLLTHWPQPWGVVVICLEFIKNDALGFFDMPFVKADVEVS
jgi:CCR4-NOT transcription complex subunit 1